MALQYVDCKLTITDDRTTEYDDDYKHPAEGQIPDDELTRFTIDRISHWVATNEQCEKEDLVLLGRHLYRLLFHGAVGKAFEDFYDVFRKQRQHNRDLRLRLTLVFHREAKRISSYPWEFLYMPREDEGFFVAGQAELILTRFVPESPKIGSLKPDDQPLKILIAQSQPYELEELDADAVIKQIDGLKGKEIAVEVVRNLPRKELSDKIKDFQPHVFHFIGHGRDGQLALVKAPEELEEEEEMNPAAGRPTEADWCDSGTVREMFADHKPRLVFLHACKGGATFGNSLKTFTSTARDLVYSEIPAVIGMQYEIETEAAATFAQVFYRALSSGKGVDEAVTEGRRELGQYAAKGRGAWGDRKFGTPLVYLQTGNPIIFTPERESDGEPNGGPVLVPCPYEGCQGKVHADFPYCPYCTQSLVKCANGHPAPNRPGKCSARDSRGNTCGAEVAVERAVTGARTATARVATTRGDSVNSNRDDATFQQ
jgi:hypothetical protein